MLKIFLGKKDTGKYQAAEHLYPNAKRVYLKAFDLEQNFFIFFHELREINRPVIVEGPIYHPQLKRELVSLAKKQDVVIIAESEYTPSSIANDAYFSRAIVQRF